MKQTEPDFWVVEYATTTQDPRTDLVIAIGGTEKAADILQRTGGFLSAAGPRGDYHRFPHGLSVEQQRPDVFGEAAYRQAVRDFRTRAARPATQHPAPAGSPSRPAPARHTP